MNIQLLAHRGGMRRAPENTRAAFKQALADSADAYECDVCLTKDKQPVLIHVDFNRDNMRKATGCTTPLSALNWKEVQQLTSENSDEPIAHLDDALRITREHQFPCFIEPKSDSEELLTIVVKRIRQFEVVELTGILTFYFRKQLLINAKRLEPKLQTSAIFINPMADFLKAATAIDANRVVLGWTGINHFKPFTGSVRRKVTQLKANGIAVEAGFILTPQDVNWALSAQIEGLWVDDVPAMRRCIAERTPRPGL